MGILSKLFNLITDSARSKKAVQESNQTASAPKKEINIPDEYKAFPLFNGNCVSITTKNEANYKRCTIDYVNADNQALNTYVNLMQASGYKKATDVRYDNNNKYIIFEPNYGNLHLVFHIKK